VYYKMNEKHNGVRITLVRGNIKPLDFNSLKRFINLFMRNQVNFFGR